MSKKLFCFDLDDTLVDEDCWFKARWNKTFKLYSNIFKPNVVKDFFDIYDLHGPYYKFHLQDLSLVHNEISSFQEQIISTFKSIKVTEKLFPGVMSRRDKNMGLTKIKVPPRKTPSGPRESRSSLRLY